MCDDDVFHHIALCRSAEAAWTPANSNPGSSLSSSNHFHVSKFSLKWEDPIGDPVAIGCVEMGSDEGSCEVDGKLIASESFRELQTEPGAFLASS